MLAKIDIENAFRNIPVHPDDRHILGMQWQNILYIDSVLPFGLCSTPKICADAHKWICMLERAAKLLGGMRMYMLSMLNFSSAQVSE